MNALVTGGGGFLGGAIVRQLLSRGDTVRSFSRTDHPALGALNVDQRHGDLAHAEEVANAATGCDIVFHVAAKAGIGGRYEDYHRANVLGTENVIAACHHHGIRRLVYTSSPSVVFDGHDMEGVNESVPYPDHYEAHYPKTKAMAEQQVLSSNSAQLATVALRPHLIWGPGDNHLIPRLLAKARAGQLRRIGHRENRVDAVYIDNAADAHLCAADRLAPGSSIAGKAYFIAQGEPLPMWDLIHRILATANLPPVQKSIPTPVALMIGSVLETWYTAFRLQREPRLTRFLVRELSTAHWFDLTAAQRDLGYSPKVSLEEGLRRLQASFQPDGRVRD
jgi:nucleoside-diphosphate-sugar epimerase